ncbi:MAG TPA: hypothetical protein VNO43_15040 [Candidatus Eisenbacteria bacterium]|nr:hypothetical protein [Candidatus Eisenbacteria bacterium]
MKLLTITSIGALIWLSSAALAATSQPLIETYVDPEYEYSFRFPADWQLRKLPEGAGNQSVRVRLDGPGRSSFTVVVEASREDFGSEGPGRSVEALIQKAIREVYRPISANIGAEKMTVGEKVDLSNEAGVQFYISTLHERQNGQPIVVAGIHAYPSGKNYSINFLMTAFFDPAATERNNALTAVFNSFRLSAESPSR